MDGLNDVDDDDARVMVKVPIANIQHNHTEHSIIIINFDFYFLYFSLPTLFPFSSNSLLA